MNEDIQTTVNAVLAKVPEWIRHELASKDALTRARAEEALAAMVASALTDAPVAQPPIPRDQIGRGARAA
jgi:hypothetical protein